MSDADLIKRYNYDSFIPAKLELWMRFDESPVLGERAPDFPLRDLDSGDDIMLSDVCKRHLYTVVEFGSFT